MSTRQELIQHAIDECARIDARYAALRVEIQRQRRAALETIPSAAAAYRAWEKASEAAEQAFRKTIEALRSKTARAEAKAPAAQASAEAVALEAWNAATRKAAHVRDRAVEKALETYEGAIDAAMKVIGPTRDARVVEARRKRDVAREEAEGEHRRDTGAAWTDYQVAMAKALNAAVHDVAEARRAESAKGDEAAAARDEAIQRADDTLEAALAAAPVAGAILEAFAGHFRRAEVACEEEKDAVTARMKVALGAEP